MGLNFPVAALFAFCHRSRANKALWPVRRACGMMPPRISRLVGACAISGLKYPARRLKLSSWPRAVIGGCVTGFALAVAVHVAHILLYTNFHVVLPGQVFRCAQLSGPQLEEAIRAHGIRTVVNLRGPCDPFPWYLDECRVTQQAGAAHEDVSFSAGRLPPVDEIRYLLRVLDRTEYPILLHCRQGADRTGLAAAMFLLLHTDADLAAAKSQVGVAYGHLRLGRTRFIDQFFDLYDEWLEAQGLQHAPNVFRHWLEEEYCPGPCRYVMELRAPPYRAPCSKPWALHVRAYNTSIKTWNFRPEPNAGVHVGGYINDVQCVPIAFCRAGLLRAEVPPGGSIELTVAMPAIAKPGKYTFALDLFDEQHGWGYQMGAKPLEREFEVTDFRTGDP